MKEFEAITLLDVANACEEFKHDFVPQTFDDYLGQESIKEKLKV